MRIGSRTILNEPRPIPTDYLIPNKTSFCGIRAAAGFSLTELLVISAMLGLAGLLIAPALARTKSNGHAIGCLNNLHQVIGAWAMYAEEHQDQVPNNLGVAAAQTTISDKTYENWVNNIVSWDNNPMNTNIMLVLRVGQLSPYLNGNSNVFKCPADVFLTSVQRSLGWTARARSISMNSVFGRFSTGSDSTAQGANWSMPSLAQYLRLAGIPKPFRTWVLLDEHPDSINDGIFIVDPNQVQWTDIPASYHNGGCGMAFADGHCEIRKWLSVTSQFQVRYYYYPVTAADATGRQDIQWLLQRTGYSDVRTGKPLYGY